MSTTPRLKRLIALSFEVQMAMRERFKRRIGEGASFPRLAILRCLTERKDMSMKDVASLMGVTPPTVTALVDALSADGLVSRKPDPQDRRGVLLHVTPKGQRLLRTGLAHVSEQMAEMFGRLSVKEQDQLAAIFKKLLV